MMNRIGPGIVGAVATATCLLGVCGAVHGQCVELIPLQAEWKYLDNGTNQGTAWRAVDFDDSGWDSGPAELGYGDGDEATEVSYGPDEDNKYITTYFRRSFQVKDLAAIQSGLLRILRDDGAVVYLNGVEVFRTNMPGGTIGYLTLAASTQSGIEEHVYHEQSVDANMFQSGLNVVAVEVHQRSAGSSDMSFHLDLRAEGGVPEISRGPYLQRVSTDEAVVRWQTCAPAPSRVAYGPAPGPLPLIAGDDTPVLEHEVVIDGLAPGTKYNYAIDLTETEQVGDETFSFTTAPTSTPTDPVRIWVIGDSGTADANAASVFQAYRDYTGDVATDVWLMLGDNAYDQGTEVEYQLAVFDMYEPLLRNTPLWPTLGNHDGGSADSPSESGVYYDLFTLPRQGEAGGWPSGTEAYYSFDHGDIHFICLDSQDTPRGENGAMMTWLEEDLADTLAEWIIAFWHHPPYTKGTHDSDDTDDSGGRMGDMRETALPILEAGGVDLVLTGHSHVYERSYLIDQAYDYGNGSSTPPYATLLADGRILDTGDGSPDGDGAYVKPTGGIAPHEGAVYVVTGNAGKTGSGSLDHPVMYEALTGLGSVILEVHGSHRLDATYLEADGDIADAFTILKGDPPPPTCDVNGDGVMDVTDLVAVITTWATNDPDADLNDDGVVDVQDLIVVITTWGPCA